MRWFLSLVFVLAASSASSASAQVSAPCGLYWPTQMFGCLDTVNDQHQDVPLVAATDPLVITGWALNCRTRQQPAAWQLLYTAIPTDPGGSRYVELPAWTYRVTLRGRRSDVTPYFQACGITSDYWGYTIQIAPNVLPPGDWVLIVRFTDGPLDGANHQQLQIAVRP